MPAPPFVGAVLAGGASRRMGTDKALVEIDGTAMAVLVAAALRRAGARDVCLIGADAAASAATGLDVVSDRWPGEGPLGGIATAALDVSGAAIVVVAACDQPDLDPSLVAALVGALADAAPEVVAAAPVDDTGRRHPLPSAWRAGAGAALAALVEAGARRADDSFAIGPVVGVAATPSAVRDIDTPEELAARRRTGRDRGAP